MARALVLIGMLAVVGVVGAVVAIAARESDAAFLYDQQHPKTIESAQLEALVMKARDPLPGENNAPATRVNCKPGRTGAQRNPWRCHVDYRSGHNVDYRVRISPSGDYEGVDKDRVLYIRGCCVVGATRGG
jgi:hypothetical protein